MAPVTIIMIVVMGLGVAHSRLQKSSLILSPDGWRLSSNLSNTTVIVGSKGRHLIGFNASSCDSDIGHIVGRSHDPVIGFDPIPVIDLNGRVHLLKDDIVPVSTLSGDILYTVPEALSPISNSTTAPFAASEPLHKFRQRPDSQKKVNNQTVSLGQDQGRSKSNATNQNGTNRTRPWGRTGPSSATNASVGLTATRLPPAPPSSRNTGSTMRSGRTSINVTSSNPDVRGPGDGRDQTGPIIDQLLNDVLDPILSSTSLWSPGPATSTDMVYIPIDLDADLVQHDVIIETGDEIFDSGLGLFTWPDPVPTPQRSGRSSQPPVDLVPIPDRLPIGVASPDQLLLQEQVAVGPGPQRRLPVQDNVPVGLASPAQLQLQDQRRSPSSLSSTGPVRLGPGSPTLPVGVASPEQLELQRSPVVVVDLDEVAPQPDLVFRFGLVPNLEAGQPDCSTIMI